MNPRFRHILRYLFAPRRLLTCALWLAAAIFTFGIVAPWFPDTYWRFDQLAHLRLHALTAGLVLLGLSATTRRWWLAAVTGVLVLVQGAVTLAWPQWSFPPAEQKVYRAVAFNLHAHNRSHPQILNWLEKTQPDFIILPEYNAQHRQALNPLLEVYPYQLVGWKWDDFGVALYSRYPVSLLPRKHGGEPALHARVETPDGPLYLLGVHPLSPQSESAYRTRNSQFESIARHAAQLPGPLLVMGDFNCSPWSEHFKKLVSEGGLTNGQTGLFQLPTWPTLLPNLGIPIDHALYKGSIQPILLERGPHLGSDHRPIVFNFTMGYANESTN